MPVVPISEISPGEAVLAREKIEQYRDTLARGEELEPICIYLAGSRQIVRDGNNRVRAFIEHHEERNLPLPPIPCVASSAPPPKPVALEGLKRMSRYYGVGADAFLRMPAVDPKDYEAEQTRIARTIWNEPE